MKYRIIVAGMFVKYASCVRNLTKLLVEYTRICTLAKNTSTTESALIA